MKIENRTIEQLQNKYKALKKQARKVSADVKRDIARTGNKALQSKTLKELRGNSALLSLRARMGASATGFTSKHCMYFNAKLRIIEHVFTRLFKYICMFLGSDAGSTQKLSAVQLDQLPINERGNSAEFDIDNVEIGERFGVQTSTILAGVNSSATIVRPPLKKNIAEEETTEHGEPMHGQSSSSYQPRSIRQRKRRQFPGSGKS